MHARILTYLDEVARRGSIRAAAERLNVSPSAISRLVKSLEEELGVPILARNGRSVVLTAAGEILVQHVRDTLKGMTRTRALIEDLKGLRRGEIAIAHMSGLATNILPRVILQFRRANPRVAVVLHLMTAGELITRAVAQGEVDLGLAFDLQHAPGVRTLSVTLARLGAVVAPSHPLAERSSLRIADCADYPLILADRTTAIRPYIDRAFERVGYTPYAPVETNSIDMMRILAIMGDGVTFLTPFDIEHEMALGRLTYVPVHEFTERPQALQLIGTDRHPTALASIFAEHVKSAVMTV